MSPASGSSRASEAWDMPQAAHRLRAQQREVDGILASWSHDWEVAQAHYSAGRWPTEPVWGGGATNWRELDGEAQRERIVALMTRLATQRQLWALRTEMSLLRQLIAPAVWAAAAQGDRTGRAEVAGQWLERRAPQIGSWWPRFVRSAPPAELGTVAHRPVLVEALAQVDLLVDMEVAQPGWAACVASAVQSWAPMVPVLEALAAWGTPNPAVAHRVGEDAAETGPAGEATRAGLAAMERWLRPLTWAGVQHAAWLALHAREGGGSEAPTPRRRAWGARFRRLPPDLQEAVVADVAALIQRPVSPGVQQLMAAHLFAVEAGAGHEATRQGGLPQPLLEPLSGDRQADGASTRLDTDTLAWWQAVLMYGLARSSGRWHGDRGHWLRRWAPFATDRRAAARLGQMGLELLSGERVVPRTGALSEMAVSVLTQARALGWRLTATDRARVQLMVGLASPETRSMPDFGDGFDWTGLTISSFWSALIASGLTSDLPTLVPSVVAAAANDPEVLAWLLTRHGGHPLVIAAAEERLLARRPAAERAAGGEAAAIPPGDSWWSWSRASTIGLLGCFQPNHGAAADQMARRVLRSWLSDPVREVREAAIAALGRLGGSGTSETAPGSVP